MNTKSIGLVLLATMVVLAGCSGGTGNATPGDDSDGSTTGTVNFYVSDQPGALGDFETLNVTITRVGFERAAGTNNTTAMNESSGGWIERDINDTTVDLTRLAGDNATLLESVSVPNGSYEKVFAYVSEVNGTTTDGQRQRVKLPSGKLQLTTPFTVEANESVDFVFDIKVIKAGNSGKYILRPVISESGTDRPIREVDARTERDDETDE